jgi:hypothetical protein
MKPADLPSNPVLWAPPATRPVAAQSRPLRQENPLLSPQPAWRRCRGAERVTPLSYTL